MPDLVYCLVDFPTDGGDTGAVPVYVVPSETVATVLREMHDAWKVKPGQRVLRHGASDVRNLRPDYVKHLGEAGSAYPPGWLEPYRNRWDFTGGPTVATRRPRSAVSRRKATEAGASSGR